MSTWYDGPDPAALRALSFARSLSARQRLAADPQPERIDLAGEEAFLDLLTRLPGRVHS